MSIGPDARLQADPHRLSEEAASVLSLIEYFYSATDEALMELFGKNYRRNPVRHQLMRMIVAHNGQGEVYRLSTYQRLMEAKLRCSRETTRIEAMFLADNGLLILDRVGAAGRETWVRPTQGLIDWYNRKMPGLMSGTIEAISAYLAQTARIRSPFGING